MNDFNNTSDVIFVLVFFAVLVVIILMMISWGNINKSFEDTEQKPKYVAEKRSYSYENNVKKAFRQSVLDSTSVDSCIEAICDYSEYYKLSKNLEDTKLFKDHLNKITET